MTARDELRKRALDPDTPWYDSEYTVDSLLDAHAAEARNDDAAGQKLILAALVKTRREAIVEVTAMLRRTPRYDKDYAAMIRAARRIEDWASG